MSNSASTLAAGAIRVPTTGLNIVGGPLVAPYVTGQTYDFLEFSASSSQPSIASGNQQEMYWNTTPITQSGASWYATSLWSTTATGTSGVGSIFKPGANGLGLYTVSWEHFWTGGIAEFFILKNVAAGSGGSTYGTNNMKTLTTNNTSGSRGQVGSAQILISAASDYIAFGWYNGTGNATAIPMATERVYLRILRQ